MMPSTAMSSSFCPLLCRNASALALSKLLPPGPHCLPKCVVVTGPPRCGKSTLTSSVIQDLQYLKSAQASCQQGTIHPKLIFESLLCQLLDLDRCSGADMSSPVRCDTLGEFVDLLLRHEGDILGRGEVQGIVLVLRNAERIRELDANLLPGFMRLQELTGINVCVLLLSRVSFNKFLIPSGLPRPYVVQLKPYTKEELVKIISVKLRDSDPKQLQASFYENYAKLVLDFCLPASNSLPQLLWLSTLHFSLYREPVSRGEVEADNVRLLYRRIEKPLRESLNAMHLKEKEGKVNAAANKACTTYAHRRLHVELPFHSKFLLIAAYLASYNPEKSDKRFFMKHHGKQRKTAQSVAAKAARQTLHLSGPKAFPLDRLLAIFYSIVEEDVVPSVHVLSQVASLVTLQFLIHVSSDDTLDQPKYKCIVGLNFVEQISNQVDFEIHKYLFDFA